MRSARRKTIGIGPDVTWRGDTSTSALRRRIARAQVAADLRPLRWHELRDTYGSLLAANGVDLVTIQAVMGHSALATTGRYLHARPASDQPAMSTRAFEASPAPAQPTRAA